MVEEHRLFILLRRCASAVAQQEVEVAALIGLQDAIFEQFRIAAPRGLALLWRLLQCSQPLSQFGVRDEKFKAPSFDVQPNPVAIVDDSERSPNGRLRRDMKHDRAEGAPERRMSSREMTNMAAAAREVVCSRLDTEVT
jgi:hypothetical protein